MRFAHLWILHFLWLVPLTAVALIVVGRKRQQAMEAFADATLLKRLTGAEQKRHAFFKGFCLLTSIAMILVALAGPQWGSHYQEISQKGVDIILLVDVSPSMLVEDISPSRLGLATSTRH